MTVLVIAEHDNTSLKAVTRNTVAAAAAIGAEIHVLVAGAGCAAVAQAAVKLSGVTKVKLVDAPHYADHTAENLAALIASLAAGAAEAAGYSHVFAAASTTGKNTMPRVAALLDVGQISEIVGIKDADIFVRPIYAGNVMATVQSLDPVKVITVRSTGFDAVDENGSAAVEPVAAGPDLALSRVVGREIARSERPELTGARIIVSGGRGLGSGDNYRAVLEPLADKLGAALGASRAAVDAGYVSNDYQVGQTGKIVAPELYIAVGISGAIQHLAGMKDSKVIVAINKDPDAPIFQVADFGLVGDLFDNVPQLTGAIG